MREITRIYEGEMDENDSRKLTVGAGFRFYCFTRNLTFKRELMREHTEDAKCYEGGRETARECTGCLIDRPS